jgi:hypothetical protein
MNVVAFCVIDVSVVVVVVVAADPSSLLRSGR